MIRLSPRSTPFPYTTLFRSEPGDVLEPGSDRELLCDQRLLALFQHPAPLLEPAGTLLQPRQPLLDHLLAPLALAARSEEHTSELQSRQYLVCRLLLEKKKNQ